MKVWFLALSLMVPAGLWVNLPSGGSNPEQPQSRGRGEQLCPPLPPLPPLRFATASGAGTRCRPGQHPQTRDFLTLHVPFAALFKNSFSGQPEEEGTVGAWVCEHRAAQRGQQTASCPSAKGSRARVCSQGTEPGGPHQKSASEQRAGWALTARGTEPDPDGP